MNQEQFIYKIRRENYLEKLNPTEHFDCVILNKTVLNKNLYPIFTSSKCTYKVPKSKEVEVDGKMVTLNYTNELVDYYKLASLFVRSDEYNAAGIASLFD